MTAKRTRNAPAEALASPPQPPTILGAAPAEALASPPQPPTILGAAPGEASVTVAFVPPADAGGQPVIDYTVTAYDTIVTANGGQQATGELSPITVSGLTDGDVYTFTVTARTAAGSSEPSAPSAGVVPSNVAVPASSEPPLPNAIGYPVSKPINLVQLIDELSQAVGQQVNVVSVGPQDGPSTLWIAPASLDAVRVQTAIANHVADPHYGVPASTLAYQAIISKVTDNPDVELSQEEVKQAINGLLLRTNALMYRR